ARIPGCRENPRRLAHLNWQGVVVSDLTQSRTDRVKRFPATRRPPRPTVHHQVFGTLGNLGVEVVAEHAQRRFLYPAFAGNLPASSRPDVGSLQIRDSNPITAATRSISCVSGRSPSRAGTSSRTR